MKTNADDLGALFDTFVEALREKLKDNPSAAELAQIRQFLADNNISVVGQASDPLKGLVDDLPFGTDIDHNAQQH